MAFVLDVPAAHFGFDATFYSLPRVEQLVIGSVPLPVKQSCILRISVRLLRLRRVLPAQRPFGEMAYQLSQTSGDAQ